jgi:hypothetical protein
METPAGPLIDPQEGRPVPDPFNTPALYGPSHPTWCAPERRDVDCCDPGDDCNFHRSTPQVVHPVASGDDTEAAVELAVERWTVGKVEHAAVVALRTDRLGDALDMRPAEARRLVRLLLDAADICDGVQADWTVTA